MKISLHNKWEGIPRQIPNSWS